MLHILVLDSVITYVEGAWARFVEIAVSVHNYVVPAIKFIYSAELSKHPGGPLISSALTSRSYAVL